MTSELSMYFSALNIQKSKLHLDIPAQIDFDNFMPGLISFYSDTIWRKHVHSMMAKYDKLLKYFENGIGDLTPVEVLLAAMIITI